MTLTSEAKSPRTRAGTALTRFLTASMVVPLATFTKTCPASENGFACCSQSSLDCKGKFQSKEHSV